MLSITCLAIADPQRDNLSDNLACGPKISCLSQSGVRGRRNAHSRSVVDGQRSHGHRSVNDESTAKVHPDILLCKVKNVNSKPQVVHSKMFVKLSHQTIVPMCHTDTSILLQRHAEPRQTKKNTKHKCVQSPSPVHPRADLGGVLRRDGVMEDILVPEVKGTIQSDHLRKKKN